MDNYNNYYNGYATASQAESELALRNYVSSVMFRVYGKMFLGLLVTAITSLLVLTNETLMALFFSSRITFFVLAFAELGLVFYLSARIDKLQASTATALFYLYAVLNGVTLTPIFAIYTGSSIALTFGITSVTFGAMCLYGYLTKQDLSKMGSILFMALIGLILCTIVNLFLHSSAMDWIISLAGVAIFMGLTAWDTQSIKRMVEMADPGQTGKIATLGALSLYLDFINLFIYLLRIFGSRD
ncbi:MAG: Bax inhibitor-1/YccA family protein [Muribaculaceae bacterium]|nr:Bax inhibitor-1/YccA family protein [Muribaculaceae bacterium]MBR1727251.1 Bax inhibitor-1/YccA family protein [Muribaculaceae bacterium]